MSCLYLDYTVFVSYSKLKVLNLYFFICSLTAEDFDKLSCFIVQKFQTENKSIYYTKANAGMRCRGKLFDAYNNYRNSLAKAGVIQRRQKTFKAAKPVTQGNSKASFILTVIFI